MMRQRRSCERSRLFRIRSWSTSGALETPWETVFLFRAPSAVTCSWRKRRGSVLNMVRSMRRERCKATIKSARVSSKSNKTGPGSSHGMELRDAGVGSGRGGLSATKPGLSFRPTPRPLDRFGPRNTNREISEQRWRRSKIVFSRPTHEWPLFASHALHFPTAK